MFCEVAKRPNILFPRQISHARRTMFDRLPRVLRHNFYNISTKSYDSYVNRESRKFHLLFNISQKSERSGFVLHFFLIIGPLLKVGIRKSLVNAPEFE